MLRRPVAYVVLWRPNVTLRVVVAVMRWDYGFPERGLSFEYTNIYDSLSRMDGVEAELFDFMDCYKRGGHELVRQELVALIDDFRPDLLFAVLFTDEVPMDLLADLRDRPIPITFNWFCDDHWRFEDFTSVYAPLFNACSTTARSALPKFEAIGYDRVIKTQWACNQHLYRPTGNPSKYEVTFVGQPHGDRRHVVDWLGERGVPVRAWGHGWENGRLDQEEMVAVFAESKINLNLSNASVSHRRRWWPWQTRRIEQIKGRNFEIPGCGGFQLSGSAEDIESYYEPDREIVLFEGQQDLLEKARQYLADDGMRNAIAAAGYRRTLAEHTYEHRFRAIFAELGLNAHLSAT